MLSILLCVKIWLADSKILWELYFFYVFRFALFKIEFSFQEFLNLCWLVLWHINPCCTHSTDSITKNVMQQKEISDITLLDDCANISFCHMKILVTESEMSVQKGLNTSLWVISSYISHEKSTIQYCQ